jgi:2,4-diaminopentanoate dehydrogenase
MKIRVVQWGIGNVGREALAAVIANPELELVGVWRHSAQGEGADVGELLGLPRTGIKATRSLEEIVALEADCVLYMPRLSNLDEVCALLASGKNVISTPFAFFAEAMPPAQREKVVSACKAGRSTLYGTGINPGFAGMIQPVVLAGMSRNIRKVSISERANWSYYNNAQITFTQMRFGHAQEQALLSNNPFAQFNSQIFSEQIYMLAYAFGIELDNLVTEQDLVLADKDFDILCGHVKKDTVCGQRYHWQGIVDSNVVIEIDALWSVGQKYPDHWPKPLDGWTVSIEGSPSMQSHFLCCASLDPDSKATLEDHVHATEIATAMQAVNSIMAVCEAAPGIVAAHELRLASPYRPFFRSSYR